MYSEEKFEKQLEDLIEVSEDIWVNGILASVNNEDENIYGRKYNGINSIILSITRLVNSYRSNKWVTFNELRKEVEQLRKEKSPQLFFSGHEC